MSVEQSQKKVSPAQYEADEDDFDYRPESAKVEPEPQVSSLVAIIRIVSVLAMGLCISFGLFIMLVGVEGIVVGVPLVLLAIPCYFGMQWAERLARREASPPTPD
jgi:hypothetical protein